MGKYYANSLDINKLDDNNLTAIIKQAQSEGAPVSTAVVHPCDVNSLEGALEAAELGIIEPILVGPKVKIQVAADAIEADLSKIEIVDVAHSHEAAEVAVSMVRSGQAKALMKGSLATGELLSAVMDKTNGLRTGRRLSHVFVMDVESYHKPLLVADGAINIAPNLEDKKNILQNTIDCAHALGIKEPKAAILAAVEKVNVSMPATLEAAALCKMVDRHQITGPAIVDGPLAFDNAISAEAARDKHIDSPVSGEPDILLVPDLEAGNILVKQLQYLGGAQAAGIVMGARAPIILTSRAAKAVERLASCAVAVTVARKMPKL